MLLFSCSYSHALLFYNPIKLSDFLKLCFVWNHVCISNVPKKHTDLKSGKKLKITEIAVSKGNGNISFLLLSTSFHQRADFTCSFWYISMLIALTSSSCCRRPISVSCFSWMSFSSNFMASSISCFMLTWTTSSFSISYKSHKNHTNTMQHRTVQQLCNVLSTFWKSTKLTLTELQYHLFHHIRDSAPL